MVQGDPKQLQELLGTNMAMVLNAFLQCIGTLIITFVFGWKLSLVALFVTIPLILASGWYRTKYEQEFVKMSAAVSVFVHRRHRAILLRNHRFSTLTLCCLITGRETDPLHTLCDYTRLGEAEY